MTQTPEHIPILHEMYNTCWTRRKRLVAEITQHDVTWTDADHISRCRFYWL